MKLGDRMKGYESSTTSATLMRGLPIIARLDGKAFHTFTKDLTKPYSKNFCFLMRELLRYMVKYSNANCGYTQSDEITLVWYHEDVNKPLPFNGRVFKLNTTLASAASVYFNDKLPHYLPQKKGQRPTFDCRVFNVPTLEEAANCFLWRELDATKNSINAAAQHYYTHKELQGKNQKQMQEMLFAKGVNWNEYPAYFKRGSYYRYEEVEKDFTAVNIESLPPKHNARLNPNLKVKVRDAFELIMPPILKVRNRVSVLLFGEKPKTE